MSRYELPATYINIVAPTGGLIIIRSGVDKQRIFSIGRVARTDIKRTLIPIRYVRVFPCHGISRERKSPVRVLGRVEPGLQGALRLVRWILHPHVQSVRGTRAGVIHKLAVDNVELPRSSAAVHQGIARCGGWQRLEVGMIVGRLYCPDPVPPRKQGRGCA